MRKIISLGLVGLFVQLMGCAHPTAAPENAPVFHGASKPIPIQRKDAGLMLTVNFDGKDHSCLLDTALAHSYLFNPSIKTTFLHDTLWDKAFSKGESAFFMVTIDKLRMGGLDFSGAEFVMADKAELKPQGYACVIGLDLFKDRTLVFNFHHKTLEIRDSIPGKAVPRDLMDLPGGLLGLTFEVEGRTFHGLFASAPRTTIVSQAVVDKNGKLFVKKAGHIQGIGWFGQKENFPAYGVKSLRLESAAPLKMIVGSRKFDFGLDPKLDAILGYDLITKYNWAFDLRNRKWARF